MIEGRNFFDQTVKDNLLIYDSTRKITADQGVDYKPGCLLYYPCLKNYYEMIAMDLSKQQRLDANPKAIQQIDFTVNLEQDGKTTMLLIIEEMKETILDFLQGTFKVLWIYFTLI